MPPDFNSKIKRSQHCENMKKVTFGRNELSLFDSLESLPPHRESLMNFYLLSEIGIGHTFESINQHLSGIRMAASQGDLAAISQEVENLTLNYLAMAGKYNPKHIAWVCLIDEINGEAFSDLSEDNLIITANKLSEEGGSEAHFESIFDTLKKNFPRSWRPTSLISEIEEEDLLMSISDLD